MEKFNRWYSNYKHLCTVQFSSVTQSCLTLCNPTDWSTPGLPVHHQLLEFTHTHVDWVGDAIQPSHPVSSPFPPALNLSQHQGLFQWVRSLHQLARVVEFQLQASTLLALSFNSHYYTCMHTTGKTIALTRWTFVDKVMSLHLTMHSRTPFHDANANNHKRGNQQQHNNYGISSPHLYQQTVLPQRKSIRKQALNETISHTDLNAIYRTFLQQQENRLSSQVHMEHSLG